MQEIIQAIIDQIQKAKINENDKHIISRLDNAVSELNAIIQPEQYNKAKFYAIIEKLLPWVVVGEKCFRDIIHLWTSDK